MLCHGNCAAQSTVRIQMKLKEYWVAFMFSALATGPLTAEEWTQYQHSVVGEVILDSTEYCSWKAEAYESEEARTATIENGFVNSISSLGVDFIILDTSKLLCGVGDSGSCGSAGCTIWIIGPTEQTVRIGKLVNIPEGFDENGKRTLYCGSEVEDWDDCVDVRKLLK